MTDCCGQHNLIITYKSVFPCQGNTLRFGNGEDSSKGRNTDKFPHRAPSSLHLIFLSFMLLTPRIMQSWIINVQWCLGKKPVTLTVCEWRIWLLFIKAFFHVEWFSNLLVHSNEIMHQLWAWHVHTLWQSLLNSPNITSHWFQNNYSVSDLIRFSFFFFNRPNKCCTIDPAWGFWHQWWPQHLQWVLHYLSHLMRGSLKMTNEQLKSLTPLKCRSYIL